jgi:predicted transposase YbfD/YdcC
MTASIIEHFSGLEDPRMARKRLHALMDIIVLVICGVISGAEGWEAIEEFGHEKLDWLRHFIPLKNGIPSHDCIAYVISRLSIKGFRECFRSWSQAVAQQTEGQVINVDGKTARGSRDRNQSRNPLHMVSAWANDNRLVLGQEAVDDKSNEITAIPKLLALLELTGCIVTIDAMGCQREIASQIIEQGGDYVLSLKGNQTGLHTAVQEFFDTAARHDYAQVKYDFKEELDKGHGRLETRRYWITGHLETLPAVDQWKGLASIGMVERLCWMGEKETCERRYFINSLAPDAKRFAKAVREHWGIENRLHWRLDVLFHEDANRIRRGNAPTIMTTIRHLCLGLCDADSSRGSLAKKRRKASWNDNYRANLVFGKKF